MYLESVLKASPIPATLWHTRHSVVGFNHVEEGFEEP
jgi:hypothetical protein